MSSRHKGNSAAEALARLKEARTSGKKTALDLYDDEDIYDEVSESEYMDRVAHRRGDDFIVDDGNDLGYGDDGEENWNDYEYDETLDFDQNGDDSSSKTKKRVKKKPNEPKKSQKISQAFLTHRRVAQMNSRVAESSSENVPSKKSRAKQSMPAEQLDDLLKDLVDDSDDDEDVMMGMTPSEESSNHESIALFGQSTDVARARREIARRPSPLPSSVASETFPSDNLVSVKTETFSAGIAAEPAPAQEQPVSTPELQEESLTQEPSIVVKPESLPAPQQHQPSKRIKVVTPVKKETPLPPPQQHQQTPSQKMFTSITTSSSTDVPLIDSANGNTMEMYWIDAYYDQYQSPDKVFLLGKVKAQSGNGFINVCVAVHNLERNVFVLPKEGVSFPEVYDEIEHLCQQNGITEFKCKPVQRKVCFDKEDDSIPDETEFLKLVYPASLPELPASAKGRTFIKLSGVNRSPLELFILKRGLKGPSWISISNVLPSKSNVSWSTHEFCIESQKSITVCQSQDKSPSLSVLSIDVQSVFNPTKKKNEIIMISLLLHQDINIDGPTESPENCQQFTFMRSPSGQWPVDLETQLDSYKNIIRVFPNERVMLPCFFNLLKSVDPDILLGHRLSSIDLPLLVQRAHEYKLTPLWSTIGRLRRSKFPKASRNGFQGLTAGRLLCDTLVSSKEFVRQVDYQLSSLAKNLLNTHLQTMAPADIPEHFNSSSGILTFLRYSSQRCHLALSLAFHLVAIPLTKQLTCLCGNLWSGSLRSSRAERVEYLLLHEFHGLKYIVPENKIASSNSDEKTEKGPKYQGGLVLEPKRGFYDEFILLLDFNSLYPSIIQEYDICFTTQPYWELQVDHVPEMDIVSGDVKGVLPSVIMHLLSRRRSVKQLLKKEENPLKAQQLDIRQKALKLVANAMYGCLGFAFSRFHCKPLASLVTALGRTTLSNTVQLAENLGYEVIYGDTDSIMVNTKSQDLSQAKSIGNHVKQMVNKVYNKLEIDIDGIYKSMLLLRKKKYAALSVVEGSNGVYNLVKEMKGLDLVRRDWCPLSKDIGIFVVDEILSGKDHDEIVESIQTALQNLSSSIQTYPTNKFIITKSLTKAPHMYSDAKAHPHVHVALEMVQQGRNVSIGDNIPFVVCSETTSSSIAERSHHPHFFKTNELALDYQWYLIHQILAPISRLCEPIPGLEPSQIATCLGLDASKYTSSSSSSSFKPEDDGFSIDLYEYDDQSAFRDVDKLFIKCSHCLQTSEFLGFFDSLDKPLLTCPTKDCKGFFQKESDVFPVLNSMKLHVNKCIQRFFLRVHKCDEIHCEFSRGTRHSLNHALECPKPRCPGRLVPEFSIHRLYKTLRYLQLILDYKRALVKSQKKGKSLHLSNEDCKNWLSCTKDMIDQILEKTSYHWVEPAQVFSSILSS